MSLDGHEIIRDVVRQLDTKREDARRLTWAVVTAVDEAGPGLVGLPREVCGVLVA